MTEIKLIVNLVVELSGVMICVMAILLLSVGPKIGRLERAYFRWCFSCCIVFASANIAGLLMRGLPGSGWRAALYVSNYVEFLMPTAMAYLITRYLLDIVGPEQKKTAVRRGTLALLIAHVIMLTVSQFTGLVYIIGPDNLYRRQPWYPLCLVSTALILLNDFVIVLKYRRKLTKKELAAFLIYFTAPAAALVLQSIQYGINYSVFSTFFAGFTMYLFIVSDQTERYEREQRENARQQASILLLQMRPHFIYNTMMSIYHLCAIDPMKAQQVTGDFTDYLRQNFTAIAAENTIPFTQELAHTRAYLAVEKARFEDKLFVDMDTPLTTFKLPPLTLQPIVENAVKHGISPELEPLHISIRTRETEQGCEITVEDNGPGGSPTDDGGPHIALENIRQRLRMMCGGTLTIEQGSRGGTLVIIRIPFPKAADANTPR